MHSISRGDVLCVAETAQGTHGRPHAPNNAVVVACGMLRVVCCASYVACCMLVPRCHGRTGSAGYCCRDIKPSNVLLAEPVGLLGDSSGPVAKLTDFGLAVQLDHVRLPWH